MNRRALLQVVLLSVIACSWSNGQEAAQPIAGKVVAVSDGDTLTLLQADKTKLTVRLEGIDAPVLNRDVSVMKIGEDRYGRTLGNMVVRDKDVNRLMVEQGWAWHFKKYSKDQSLAAAEERARSAKAGLWAGENILSPWDYRARQKVGEVPADGRRWLNTSTGVRHNEKCRSFNNTKKGRFCEVTEGKACGICGR